MFTYGRLTLGNVIIQSTNHVTLAELVGAFHDIEINTFISTADYISDMLESKLLRIQCAHYDNIVLHQNSKVTSTKNS